MKIVRFFLCFLFLALLSLQRPIPAQADDKENSSATITYTVNDSGTTHVTAHISLTNTTTIFFVSSYSLKLGFTTLSNLQASDPSGPLTPTVKPSDAGQEITIQFKSVVAGKGNTLPFTLSFDTPDIATQNGSIWEVNIPGLANQNDFQTFSTDVFVPSSFGKPTFIKPDVGNGTLHFTKDQLGKSGISIAFGQSQTYAYSLQYHLENTSVVPVRTEIALPPTTNYQDVQLQDITPKPDNVILDTDGNWLAQYQLLPSQKLTVTTNGLIAVSLNPKEADLSEKERKMYLQKQSYWQVDNQQIITLAQKLKTPEAIYDYVVSHLSYDFNRVTNQQTRVGALGVLQNPSSAVCLEFTDLFIALSRAAGIPAREIDGFAYTQNTISRPLSLSKDVLHAWPEYYDDEKKTWIMVDPTWGNTTGGVDYFHTLDFDHVAFVVKGLSSIYPVPAGGYKFAGNENEKDVLVNISQQHIDTQPTISMGLTLPQSVMGGLPVLGSVALTNTGTVLFPKQPIEVTSTTLLPKDQFISSPDIPPFGKTTLNFGFRQTPLLTNATATVTMSIGGKTTQEQVAIVPLTTQYAVIGGIILAILTSIIFIITARSRRVSISRQ